MLMEKNDLENISKIIKLKKGAVLNIYKLLKKKRNNLVVY